MRRTPGGAEDLGERARRGRPASNIGPPDADEGPFDSSKRLTPHLIHATRAHSGYSDSSGASGGSLEVQLIAVGVAERRHPHAIADERSSRLDTAGCDSAVECESVTQMKFRPMPCPSCASGGGR